MTVLVYFRDGHIEVIEDASTIDVSDYSSAINIRSDGDVKELPKRDIVKIEALL